MVTIAQLEYYVASIESGHFAVASRILYVNPSTISLAMTRLEKEVGTTLLIRSQSGITPTKAGERFHALSCNLLSCFNQIKTFGDKNPDGNSGHQLSVALGLDCWHESIIKAAVLDSFRRKHPHIKMRVYKNSNSVCLKALEKGVSDVALILGPVANSTFTLTKVSARKVKVLLSKDHPLAKVQSIHISDLHNLQLITTFDASFIFDKILDVFSKHSLQPRFDFVYPSQEELFDRLVMQGNVAFTCMPDEQPLSHKDFVAKPLCAEDSIYCPVYCAQPNTGKSEVATSFVSHLVDQCTHDTRQDKER